MEFVKKHYEKVVLALVILVLLAAAALLPFIIKGKKDKLVEYSTALTTKPVKPLPALDTSVQEGALQRAQGIYLLDLTTKHNTFNPVKWLKDTYGKPVKVTGADVDGVGSIEITDIRELYMIITYDRADSTGGYYITVEKQGSLKKSERQKQGAFVVKGGSKSDAFTLVEAKGPPENPTELILQPKDSTEPISVTPAKPYKKVDGYTADLKYKVDNRTFMDHRVGDRLTFGSGGQYRYKIVAINQTGVVLSAESNNKNTPISFNPSH